MARNSEKAMTALARWRQLQLKEQGKLRVDRRPLVPNDEMNVRRAEKWRYQVVREIAKKVAQIQNGNAKNVFVFLVFFLNFDIFQRVSANTKFEI